MIVGLKWILNVMIICGYMMFVLYKTTINDDKKY